MIYLMRHGQDDDSRLGGWSDAGLSVNGIIQVQSAAQKLADGCFSIRRIVSSDLPRAAQTAGIVGRSLAIAPEFLSAFREINNGEMAGMLKTEAAVRYPGIYYSTLGFEQCYPNGESPALFFRRISQAWAAFKAQYENSDGDTLLVTHGGVIDIIMCIENRVEYTNRQVSFRLGHAEIAGIPEQQGEAMNAKEMWSAFCTANDLSVEEYEAWAFGDDPDKLAALVLEGKKTGTSSAYAIYEAENEHLPQSGEYSIILNSRDEAQCLIKTNRVYTVPFCQVSAEHARMEGEGDLSLEYWRQVHVDFFRGELASIGLEFSEEMLVVCEEFEVVFPHGY